MLLKDSRKKKVFYLLLLISFSYVFFFYGLGSYSLKEPDEGRYAEIPREMVEQGDYIVPHLNYVRYFEKPPLLYWATAASYRAFGLSEWSFRFPNALAAFLCVLVTYLFASRRFGQETGFLSSIILMTSFGFFAMAHIVTIDMLFTFLLSASLFCFYEYYMDGRRRFLNLFFAALALAVLAKGPVAIILMAATILIFLFYEKKMSFLKEVARPGGLLLFTAISAPWFIGMCIKEREFFHFFFIDQHILRFLTTKHNRSEPVYFFVPVLFGGLLPWSVFLPRAIARFRQAKDMRLLLIWSAVVFVFFSVSGSKLTPYILPVFPALAVILGGLFQADWERRPGFRVESFIYLLLFGCLAFAGFAYGTGLLGATTSRMAAQTDLKGLSLGLAVISSVLFIFVVARPTYPFRLYFFVLSTLSLCIMAGILLHAPVIDRFNTTKALAQTINNVERDKRIVFNFNSFDETLPFYLRQRTCLVDETGELEMGAKYADAKEYFVDQDQFVRVFRSDQPVFVVLKEKRLARVKLLIGEDFKFLSCQGKRCLGANSRAIESLRR